MYDVKVAVIIILHLFIFFAADQVIDKFRNCIAVTNNQYFLALCLSDELPIVYFPGIVQGNFKALKISGRLNGIDGSDIAC